MKFLLPFRSCFTSDDAAVVDEHRNEGLPTKHGFRVFSYKEIKAATSNFHSSNKIGQGGFGSVYKGRLRDGTMVAVKALSVELESLRGEREFVAEIAALSDVKHQNLVTLRGCCIEGADRFLIYDYMENSCLARSFLAEEQTRKKFDWDVRRNISIGIARGLAYLHEEVRPYIVHRDIKGGNILLDRNFTPKVADFGLSKLLGDNISHVSTRVAGTLGYLAPEYAISGHLTRKSDVYSFGVLLLEIITGRPVVAFDLENGEHHLVQKVWEVYRKGTLVKIVDPVLVKGYPEEEAVRFLKVGLLCVQEAARFRPRMSAALKMLTGETDVVDVKISQPTHIVNLMDIHIEDRKSNQSIFSKESDSPTAAL
ncbi:putative serine/threonine-protein kinase [Punica granatum]|uniref:Protein kinase domain-containing protein n=2 Tax=Punica granatum TaxID=22663 RepID=A0A218XCG0_PUNGR|nr:putative serine/threonine-protein kinase [Punica granatum]OWM82400.1 hypothetical protein CDL15_Pgr001974 [Punica granatum]PKI65167.1 hypothetical protein CRG98_014481 [Punica granatum]